MDRGAWQAAVHRVTQNQTQLKRQHTCFQSNYRKSLYDSDLLGECLTKTQ